MKQKRKSGPRAYPTAKAVDPALLKHLRAKELNWDQVRLAEAAGVALASVRKAEMGKAIKRLNAESIEQAIKKALAKPIDPLFSATADRSHATQWSSKPKQTGGLAAVAEEFRSAVTPTSPTQGFSLLTDGIIVSLVGELIQNDDDTRKIRQQCRRSYQRCLEDFAFALVYGSKIATSKDFRPSVTRPTQPGKELATRLGEICEIHVLEDDLKDGALLANAESRELIKKDLLSFADCLGQPEKGRYFHDWLAREAKIHLGTDSSLFQEGMDPEKYQFDVVRPYYRDRLLQDVVDVKTIETLISSLPKSPVPNGDPYAMSALKEFATRNALTLMTIDQEYNESAVRNGKWRMPHVTRSLVKQGSINRQEHLRDLVTLNALVAAFRHTKREKPHMLLTILVDLRDRHPFKQVRQVLERENLLVLEPSRQKEEKAQKLIALINSHARSVDSDLDRFLIERRAALRRLSPLLTREYEHELYRIFPDLTPLPVIAA